MVDTAKMNQILDLAHHMDMSIYWYEDTVCFKLNAYFQKYGFVTGTSIPIEDIEDTKCNEFWISKIKEANDLLEACKEKMREKSSRKFCTDSNRERS